MSNALLLDTALCLEHWLVLGNALEHCWIRCNVQSTAGYSKMYSSLIDTVIVQCLRALLDTVQCLERCWIQCNVQCTATQYCTMSRALVDTVQCIEHCWILFNVYSTARYSVMSSALVDTVQCLQSNTDTVLCLVLCWIMHNAYVLYIVHYWTNAMQRRTTSCALLRAILDFIGYCAYIVHCQILYILGLLRCRIL